MTRHLIEAGPFPNEHIIQVNRCFWSDRPGIKSMETTWMNYVNAEGSKKALLALAEEFGWDKDEYEITPLQ